MEKINHKKVIIITLLKVSIMIAIFFTINNWSNIKQSFDGEVPTLQIWLNHALTLSNIVFIIFLSIVFYINTLKQHKEEAKERST
jgi:hypothetical protein